MLEFFTGQIPFFGLSECTLSIFRMVLEGKFPERPANKDVVARGLDDKMWGLMETCWSMDCAWRPSTTAILRYLNVAPQAHPRGDSDSDVSASPRPKKRLKVEA